MRNIYSLLVVLVFVVPGFGFERNYSISIALEDRVIETESESEVVKITIRNDGRKDLPLALLGRLEFHFAKCGPNGGDSLFCNGPYSNWVAGYEPAPANIPAGEIHRFEVDLAKLNWSFPNSLFTGSYSAPSYSRTPKENIHFFAKARILKGYKDVALDTTEQGQTRISKIPEYDSTYSNVIEVLVR